MSFGFSIGDFVAVAKLIKDISSCLEDVQGAKTDYQDLLREFECLQQALKHLDQLQQNPASNRCANLDSIKYAALSCRRPLEQFLAKIRKYDKSLGVWGKIGVVKTTTDKLRWGFGQKEEIRKLQAYLNIHVGTINILLTEYGLERMELASDTVAANQLWIQQRLENTRDIVQKVSSSLAAQVLVVRNTETLLARLVDMITGEFRSSWRALGDMVAKVFVSTQQTYAVILEIKSSLAEPDTRWSFFQAPFIVEDALGFKFPVPSEYDYDLLDAVVKEKFKAGPGALEVKANNYEYFKTSNSNDVLTRSTRVLPGTAITMAIIVIKPAFTDEMCPMTGCSSTQTSESPGGGRICCICKVWFTTTSKPRLSLHDLVSAIFAHPDPLAAEDGIADYRRAAKRAKLTNTVENTSTFRNVRLSHDSQDNAAAQDVGGEISEPDSTDGVYRSISEHSSTNPPGSDLDQDFSTNTSGSDFELEGRTVTGSDQNLSLESTNSGEVTFDTAIRYVDKIKDRFEDHPEVYRQFLDTLLKYQDECIPIHEVYQKIVVLFSSAPDLLEEWKQFLPNSSAAANQIAVESSTSNHIAEESEGRKRKRE